MSRRPRSSRSARSAGHRFGRWPRRSGSVLVALIVAGLVAWARTRQPTTGVPTLSGSDYDRYHDKTFTCVHVADGDTIDVDAPDGNKQKTRIRLWGIDTPETQKSPQGQMHFGPEASEYTQSQVLNKPVRLVLSPDQTRDRYQRLLAYVYLSDSRTMLNERLLELGYAYADRRFAHPWMQRFVDLERKARKSNVGLWQAVTPDKMPAWRRKYE